MAENKTGPNLQAGAGFLAKRVQKSFSRAQEKVLQKLGKTMETKDEQFELCFQNLNKQQIDGNRLFKDVKAYYSSVKAVHETSRKLSQTLRDVYESDWKGLGELAVIADVRIELSLSVDDVAFHMSYSRWQHMHFSLVHQTPSEDLLWNDFEEKLNDQLVRTMENYTSQFPEVKERVAKRGRKLVDYDSSRHHLEALQNVKKKDEAKIAKAEEEFNKAQSVFEEINNELREELPVLYQSRISCYVTVFQNISNLRDVFYKEMSRLNRELYNVMKQLEGQYSTKAFIIKGLNSTSGKSKTRKSLVISNPIPCNTAFPTDHVSIQSSAENGKAATPLQVQRTESVSEESNTPSKRSSFSDSDISSSSINTPKRESMCDNDDESVQSPQESEPEPTSGQPDDSEAEAPGTETESQEVEGSSDSSDGAATQTLDQVTADDPPSEEAKTKPAPVPAPRHSFQASDSRSALLPQDQEQEEDENKLENPEPSEPTDDSLSLTPPGFLYKVVAVERHEPTEKGQLQFEKGEVILVLEGSPEQLEGQLRGIREESWMQHQDLENYAGFFLEKLIQPVQVV